MRYEGTQFSVITDAFYEPIKTPFFLESWIYLYELSCPSRYDIGLSRILIFLYDCRSPFVLFFFFSGFGSCTFIPSEN